MERRNFLRVLGLGPLALIAARFRTKAWAGTEVAQPEPEQAIAAYEKTTVKYEDLNSPPSYDIITVFVRWSKDEVEKYYYDAKGEKQVIFSGPNPYRMVPWVKTPEPLF